MKSKFDLKELLSSLTDESIEKDMDVINQAFVLFKDWPVWKFEAAFDTLKFMLIKNSIKKED